MALKPLASRYFAKRKTEGERGRGREGDKREREGGERERERESRAEMTVTKLTLEDGKPLQFTLPQQQERRLANESLQTHMFYHI